MKSISSTSRFTGLAGEEMMTTNETRRSATRQLFTAIVLAGAVMALPAIGAVPAGAALSAAPAKVQVDRRWEWTGDDAFPAAPPVPPHGCDNQGCEGNSENGNNNCPYPNETGNVCGDNGKTGGGPAVAEARGFQHTTFTSHEQRRR